MLPEQGFEITVPVPICTGTGFLALDVVMNGHPKIPLGTWAGGSFGNVLTILSYLGWKSLPVARIGTDSSARRLIDDLEVWGVDINLISQNSNDKTPVVIEKLTLGEKGIVKHSFKWECPSCGARLPKYKAATRNILENRNVDEFNLAKVFYFDRVRKSSIEIAKLSKKNGALIVFEPSSIRDEKMYLECLRLSDIVKYSSERIDDAEVLHKQVQIPLEIQTLGSNGLRYKWFAKADENNWVTIPSYKVYDLKDSVGSGDWCTAGIIHLLGKYGKAGFVQSTVQKVEEAICFGQALAALNCYYEGARGGMYSLTKEHFQELITLILKGQSPLKSVYDSEGYLKLSDDIYTCPSCDQ